MLRTTYACYCPPFIPSDKIRVSVTVGGMFLLILNDSRHNYCLHTPVLTSFGCCISDMALVVVSFHNSDPFSSSGVLAYKGWLMSPSMPMLFSMSWKEYQRLEPIPCLFWPSRFRPMFRCSINSVRSYFETFKDVLLFGRSVLGFMDFKKNLNKNGNSMMQQSVNKANMDMNLNSTWTWIHALAWRNDFVKLYPVEYVHFPFMIFSFTNTDISHQCWLQ